MMQIICEMCDARLCVQPLQQNWVTVAVKHDGQTEQAMYAVGKMRNCVRLMRNKMRKVNA